MSGKRVSVAMAAYNSEKYIKEQIDSILVQLMDNDELVISYNPSTDNTKSILQEYIFKDSRVKVVDCVDKGFLYNFESAIKNTEGEYIFLSDHDDVWLPNKIEKVLKAFEKEKADLIVHSSYVTDENLKVQYKTNLSACSTSFFGNMKHNNYSGACMAFRSWLKPYFLPIPKKTIYHDMWIGLIAGIYGKTHFISDCLVYYRRHGENYSVSHRRRLGEIIKERAVTFVYIIERRAKILLR